MEEFAFISPLTAIPSISSRITVTKASFRVIEFAFLALNKFITSHSMGALIFSKFGANFSGVFVSIVIGC